MAQEVLEIRVEGQEQLDQVAQTLDQLTSKFNSTREAAGSATGSLNNLTTSLNTAGEEISSYSTEADEGGGSSAFLAAQLAIAYRQTTFMAKAAGGLSKAAAPMTAALAAAGPAAVTAGVGLAALAAAAVGVGIAMGVAQSRLNELRGSFEQLQGYVPQTTAALSENSIAVMESSLALAELHRNSLLYNTAVTASSNLSTGLTLRFNELAASVLSTTDRIARITSEFVDFGVQVYDAVNRVNTVVTTAMDSVNLFGVSILDVSKFIGDSINPLAGLRNAFGLLGDAVDLGGQALDYVIGEWEDVLNIQDEVEASLRVNITSWDQLTTAINNNRFAAEQHTAVLVEQRAAFIDQHSEVVRMVEAHSALIRGVNFYLDGARRLGFLTEDNTQKTKENNNELTQAEKLAIKAKEAIDALAASIRSESQALQEKAKFENEANAARVRSIAETDAEVARIKEKNLREFMQAQSNANKQRMVDLQAGINERRAALRDMMVEATGFDLTAFFARTDEGFARLQKRIQNMGKAAKGALKSLSTTINNFGNATQAGLAAAFGTTEKFGKAFSAAMGSQLISSGIKTGWEGVGALASGNPQGVGMIAAGAGMVAAGRAMGGATKAPEAKKEKESTPQGSNMQVQVLNNFGFVGDRRATAREVTRTVDEARRQGAGGR